MKFLITIKLSHNTEYNLASDHILLKTSLQNLSKSDKDLYEWYGKGDGTRFPV
jgi:hypothetical protein